MDFPVKSKKLRLKRLIQWVRHASCEEVYAEIFRVNGSAEIPNQNQSGQQKKQDKDVSQEGQKGSHAGKTPSPGTAQRGQPSR